MGGFALSFLGYKSGAIEQAENVGRGIKSIASGMAGIGFILTGIILVFVFNLSKKKLAEVNKELEKRRASA